ncbi:MAG: ABC transporter permease [Clostridia bacterium]|nr:ABC transporter permease [Clostridia bacterium]
MNNIFTILKKELFRIFTDKRMLASLILPGILIFFLYSIMGSFLSSSFESNSDYNYTVYIYNEPSSLKSLSETDKYKITTKNSQLSTDEAKNLIKEKQIDLLIIYDENFDEKVLSENKPNVEIFFNSTSVESNTIYNYYITTLSSMSIDSVNYNYYVNTLSTNYDLATKEDTSMQMITMMVPFLLMLLLFSGCMSVASESIAGEKERGTIATLLVTPTKRSHIAIGKVLALAIASLVSSLSSFLGLILSLPKLMGGEQEMTLSMYTFSTYFNILILMILSVIFFTVLLSIISTFAKSVKEASQYALPVMIIVMMFGITSLLGTNNISSSILVYLIPVYNTVQCMGAIFSLTFNLSAFIMTIIANIIYISIGIFALTKMFSSEKIMFNK